MAYRLPPRRIPTPGSPLQVLAVAAALLGCLAGPWRLASADALWEKSPADLEDSARAPVFDCKFAGPNVVIVTGDGSIHALNAKTGEAAWAKAPIPGFDARSALPWTRPALESAAGVVVVVAPALSLALDAVTGDELWSRTASAGRAYADGALVGAGRFWRIEFRELTDADVAKKKLGVLEFKPLFPFSPFSAEGPTPKTSYRNVQGLLLGVDIKTGEGVLEREILPGRVMRIPSQGPSGPVAIPVLPMVLHGVCEGRAIIGTVVGPSEREFSSVPLGADATDTSTSRRSGLSDVVSMAVSSSRIVCYSAVQNTQNPRWDLYLRTLDPRTLEWQGFGMFRGPVPLSPTPPDSAPSFPGITFLATDGAQVCSVDTVFDWDGNGQPTKSHTILQCFQALVGGFAGTGGHELAVDEVQWPLGLGPTPPSRVAAGRFYWAMSTGVFVYDSSSGAQLASFKAANAQERLTGYDVGKAHVAVSFQGRIQVHRRP